jgi:hypothetical protein
MKIRAMVVEEVASDVGGGRGEGQKRIHGGELEKISWFSYHIELTQDGIS